MQQQERKFPPIRTKAPMRLRFVLMMAVLCICTAVQAQNKRISVSFNDEKASTALRKVESLSGCKIQFNYSDVDFRVTLSAKDQTALSVVKSIIHGHGLQVTNGGKKGYIVISRAEEQSEDGGNGSCIVKGRVIDSGGNPLPGSTVRVKDTQNVAVCDEDGHFSLSISSTKPVCVLTASFIGMETLEKRVRLPKGQTVELAPLVLHDNVNKVDEVVVNGFFTRSKQTFTGAAKTYTSEDLMSVSPTNIFQALSTLDPSMTITQNNAMGSNPNNIPDLVIRSTTSLATNNETGLNSPLIVIDGVESTLQALYDIDMQDIERVDVLKDASATALYGENAANGVIVIERKRVSQSPVRVRYTFTPQMSFADLGSYDLCNASQKLELERRAGLYDSSDGALDKSYYEKLAQISSGVDTDWKSKPVRNSFSHTHSLSVSGRGSGLDYNVTGNFADTRGVMKGDYRQRYGMNVYLSYRAIEKLVLTLRASHEQVKTKDSPYGSFSDYCLANPYDSPYDEYGNLRSKLSYDADNPLYEASLSSFSKTETREQAISLDVRYNFKPNLYVTAQGSYTTSRGTSDEFVSPESNTFATVTSLSQKGSYQLGNTGDDSWSAKIVGNWIHYFDKDGTMFTLNLGGELKHSDSYTRYLNATGFLSDNLTDIVYATNYPSGQYPSGSEDVTSSVGVFAAANFIYKNRYIVDGSYRLSGSSKFGENNRYAPFWSVGLGYNMHNESFIKKLGWIDMLRLRGSYGYTGSVKFDAYQATTTYHYSSDYAHYAGVGAIPYAMSNPDLTWQTTKKLNIGITSSLFHDRMNVNFDYFNELTDDMLIDMSLPPSSGATSVKNNLGKQESNGFEFSLWGKIIRTRDWEWNLSVNGMHTSTKIKQISDALKRMNDSNASSNTGTSPHFQYREGESPTAIYAVRSAGIDPASGKEIFIKQDGTYTYTYDAKDQVRVGDTNPWMQGTVSSLLMYKRFSLNMSFSYRFGGDIYNSTRMSKVENINPYKNADVRAFTERWSKPGDVVPYLDIQKTGGQTYAYTSRFVENDDEFWFSSLTLQYNTPDEWAKKIHAQKLYLSLGTEDLFRLTSAKYERGTSYPYSRSVNFTVSATF